MQSVIVAVVMRSPVLLDNGSANQFLGHMWTVAIVYITARPGSLSLTNKRASTLAAHNGGRSVQGRWMRIKEKQPAASAEKQPAVEGGKVRLDYLIGLSSSTIMIWL